MLQRWGGPTILRRVGLSDRLVTAYFSIFTAAERMGQMLDPLAVKVRISGLDPATGALLTTPPDKDSDMIVSIIKGSNPPQDDVKYRIVGLPMPFRPDGTIVFWDVPAKRF